VHTHRSHRPFRASTWRNAPDADRDPKSKLPLLAAAKEFPLDTATRGKKRGLRNLIHAIGTDSGKLFNVWY